MKTAPENIPDPSKRKTTLHDALRKFLADQADLDTRYQGRPYDGSYEREDDRINADLDGGVRAALPFISPAEAAAAVLLERHLLIQFHGEAPTGIHATRLALLDAIYSYLAGAEQIA